MPLPTADTAWPPAELSPALGKIREWSAWYSGDPEQLKATYGKTSTRPSTRPSQFSGGLVGVVSRMLWGRPVPAGEMDGRLHMPLAGDIAAVSADLLFSEPVILTAPEELGEVEATQAKLDELAEQMHPVLLEAAEASSALGGVFLRAVWDDQAQPDGPWLAPVHADAAVPEWRYGRLAAVTFWWVIEQDGQKIVRHLERHEPGTIEHAVYEGTPEKLGRPSSLTRFAATKDLDPAVQTKTDLLTAAYVPNMRPNRLWRSMPQVCHLGRSDYDGIEGPMDALDEAWSSLMRDMDLGKARAMLPDSMLQSNGPGQGASFDSERRYFVGLNMLQRPGDAGNPITLSQPAIRVEEHLRITQELMLRSISAAGYSAQSFGLAGEVAVTATEVSAKRERSMVTRDRKGMYWRPQLAHMAQVLLQLGIAHFGWDVSGERPAAMLPDAVQPDPRTVAETANLLNQAQAASIETRVRLVHTDWDDEMVADEVERIKDEQGVGVEPADGFGGGDSGPGNMPPGMPSKDGATE